MDLTVAVAPTATEAVRTAVAPIAAVHRAVVAPVEVAAAMVVRQEAVDVVAKTFPFTHTFNS